MSGCGLLGTGVYSSFVAYNICVLFYDEIIVTCKCDGHFLECDPREKPIRSHVRVYECAFSCDS